MVPKPLHCWPGEPWSISEFFVGCHFKIGVGYGMKFELAVSEGVADRNPAVALFTPKNCRPGRERKVLDSKHLAIIPEILGIRGT
jgi:hypothetical protein